jgi:hypothetical protein
MKDEKELDGILDLYRNFGASPGSLAAWKQAMSGAAGAGMPAPEEDDGEPSREALWRVFHKIRRLSETLGEIDDYFDAAAVPGPSQQAPAPPAGIAAVTLENLDEHVRRESRSA